MIRVRKYRLRPNAFQRAEMHKWIKQCCEIYNNALEHRIYYYNKTGKLMTRYEQQKELTKIRGDLEEFSSVPAAVQRSALYRLDHSYKSFFRRIRAGKTPGHPRFRNEKRYNSFSFEKRTVKIDKKNTKIGYVRIPKLGWAKFKNSGILNGELKEIVIKYDRLKEKWSLSLVYELDNVPKKSVSKTVGIDLGIKEFAVLNDGDSIKNPRYLETAEKSIGRCQKVLSRKKIGSNSFKKASRNVGLKYRRIKNLRREFHLSVAKYLVARYDLIAHERLNIFELSQGWLSKQIRDVGWGHFIEILNCKAEEAGVHVISVNPKGTTQECSNCGIIVPKKLSDRIHSCKTCGLILDRDHNAAINILNRGLRLKTCMQGTESDFDRPIS